MNLDPSKSRANSVCQRGVERRRSREGGLARGWAPWRPWSSPDSQQGLLLGPELGS